MTKKIFVLFNCLFSAISLFAWGAHDQITKKALDWLATFETKSELLSPKAKRLMEVASLFPDQMGFCYESLQGVGTFQVSPFVQADGVRYLNKWGPSGKSVVASHLYYSVPAKDYLDYFERCIRAIENDVTEIAALKIGVLIHYLGDATTPQHSRIQFTNPSTQKNHSSENFLPLKDIDFTNYQPKLIGDTRESALKKFSAWLKNYNEKSGVYALEMCPLLDGIEKKNLDKNAISKLNLKCARLSMEATADLVFTLCHLKKIQKKGAELSGRISTPTLPIYDDSIAHIVLLNADGSPANYDTFTLAGKSENGKWQASYIFKSLPLGKYKLQVSRAGASAEFSDVFELKNDCPKKVDIDLKTKKSGNIACDVSLDNRYIGAYVFPKIKRGYKYEVGFEKKDKSKPAGLELRLCEGNFPWYSKPPKKIKISDGESQLVEVEAKHNCMRLRLTNKDNISSVWVVPLKEDK